MSLISKTIHLIASLVLFLSLTAKTYTINEVAIDQKKEKGSFFDLLTLSELAKIEDPNQIDEVSIKLNDFFISSGVHFESNGRFTALKSGSYLNSYLIPNISEQIQPIFIIDLPATKEFWLAYVKFLSVKIQRLQIQVYSVFNQIKKHGSPELIMNFNNFYTCLRTISVVSQGGFEQFPCLASTLRALNLKDESAITDLANTYISLYRASRLSIVSPTEFNIRDDVFRNACKAFRDPLIQMQINSSVFARGIKQPSFWAQLNRSNPEWDQALSFYYLTPRVTDLMGPYVTTTEKPELHDSDYKTIQRRLCGPF